MSKVADITTEINNLNINKPTTFNNIPAKLIVETSDICAPFISSIHNESILSYNFPVSLKMADITTVHKKDEATAIVINFSLLFISFFFWESTTVYIYQLEIN